MKLLAVVGAFLIGILLGILGALFCAFTLDTLYGWFLEPKYGPGPGYAGWFGASTIFHICLQDSLINLKREEQVNHLMDLFSLAIGCAVTLIFAFATGKICHWV